MGAIDSIIDKNLLFDLIALNISETDLYVMSSLTGTFIL